MEASTGFPDSPMEPDEAAFPCKGCGEILEEGKAFELAGNRWHIDCFRCNTCLTLLDSDANLLLLGDGSLICNNCTYSCSACGNKIEDLAILTGDQAFCATCFRCRNCKKKIENLKYARTSQGIFCMECHESLMQRRRKKSAKNGAHRREKHSHNHHQGGTMLLDKSLPSLPPSAADRSHALSPDNDSLASEGYSDTPTELPRISPHGKAPTSKSNSHAGTPTEPPRRSQRRPQLSRSNSSKSTKRERSPAAREDDPKDHLILPATTYKANRNSAVGDPNGDEFCIPLAFDPSPAPGRVPLPRPHHSHGESLVKPPSQPLDGRTSRDYFNANGPSSTSRVASQDYEIHRISSTSESPRDSRHSSQPSSPHIAYQEIGRDPSELAESMRKRKDHGMTHASIGSLAHEKPRETPNEPRPRPNGDSRHDKFKLQEVPKSKKSGSTRSSKSDGISPSLDTSLSSKSSSAPTSAVTHVKEPIMLPTSESPPSLRPNKLVNGGSPLVAHEPTTHDQGSADSPTSPSSVATTPLPNPPQRKDSLGKPGPSKHISRRDVGTGHPVKSTATPSNETPPEKPSIPPSLTPGYNPPSVPVANGNRFVSQPTDSSPSGSTTDPPHVPVRRDRDRGASAGGPSTDFFVAHRIPPNPPSGHRSNSASISTQRSESTRNGDFQVSPSLPRYSAGGEFSMDEDLARILGNEDHQASFLRRVSNSVRHARSYSDRGTRLSREHKWPKSPLTNHADEAFRHEFNGALSSSPDPKEELAWLKNELRRERQRTVEREERLQELEAALEAKSSIRHLNSELREKRVTMADLDTQKEVVLRELERLTEHIAAAKKSDEPLDLIGLTNTVLREFAEDLQKLKSSFSPEIEELTQHRNELRDAVADLTQQRDQRALEFAQLSTRNADLAELNNQLVNQIQELYKANGGPTLDISRPDGLGIYTQPSNERSKGSIDGRDLTPSITESNMTGSTVAHELDGDQPTYLAAPVNIRKAKVNKFNWKRGGQNVAKGVTKGLKAFTSNDPSKVHREGQFPEGQPYGSVQPAPEYPAGQTRGPTPDPLRGLFGNQKQKPTSKNASNHTVSVINADGSPGKPLFGSDLEHRAEYERADIPGIVMRCIQEVEHRGMDVEGIYRKSGGNGQIQQIKEGFERSSDYDISDPDLDINAVTSTLKQYFRKLPSPLITYDVYDKLLDSAAAIVDDPPRCISLMRTAIDELPPRHRACLEVLVFHLARVVVREKENLMTSLNVAVVFAPTIMRPESLVREMSDTQTKNQAVQFLIENCQGVFLPSGE
ncbi:Rho-type gtpase-activating protein [Pseudocyphellaria aurata]|nr:Rho-type gtpase-activating protein [Pseudocyphellaria aurata]